MKDRDKTTMSVSEMRQILGLKKTDSYWLVHRQLFETVLVAGKMRVVLESFEHWYANQVKYKKVAGPPPGAELKDYSYSIPEIATLLGISDSTVYEIIKRDKLETFEVASWRRVRKNVFEAWYKSQRKYRTPEDRQRDAEQENTSMTLPQMARILGISREEAYSLVRGKRNRDVFEIIMVADKKRVTLDSFERWYQKQDCYQKVTEQTSSLDKELEAVDDSERTVLLDADKMSFTVKEAARLIGATTREIYRMIENDILDGIRIGKVVRIRRAALEWWLSSQDNAYEKEER